MTTRGRHATTPAALTALCGLALTLAACSGPAPTPVGPEDVLADDETTVETAAPPAEEDATGCVVGEWRADLDGLVAQLAAQLGETGLPVAAAEAGGSQTLRIGADGTVVFDNDMSLWVTLDLGGLAMTVRQEHTGMMTAMWAWDTVDADGGTLGYSDFDDSGYAIQTTYESDDGTSIDASLIELPSTSAADVPTAVTCSGDTLTMQPSGTPFVTTWNRVG